MARNRRNSSVSSYKSTIGLSLLKLLLVTTIVVLCVLKVVFGGEYISDCPSEPLLPVYVVISGCLPVFLGTLRGSGSTGPSKDGSKFRRLPTYYKAVLCFGIIANLSWLIFGTVLMARLITHGNLFSANCSIDETKGYSGDSLTSRGNFTSIDKDTGRMINPVETNQSEEITERLTNPDDTNQFRDIEEKTRKHLEDKLDTSSIGKAIKSTTEGTVIGSITDTVDKKGAFRQAQSDEILTHEDVTETVLGINTEPKTKKILTVLDKSIDHNITQTSTPNDEVLNLHNISSMSENKSKDYDSSKAHNASLTDELLNDPQHTSKCATCSRRLITFTLVIASIDWSIAIFGIIFVVVVLCCKTPSLKEMVPFLGSV